MLLIIFEIICVALWIRGMTSDGGKIKPVKNLDFLELMQLIDPIQICPDCMIVRTPRSRHCAICN